MNSGGEGDGDAALPDPRIRDPRIHDPSKYPLRHGSRALSTVGRPEAN